MIASGAKSKDKLKKYARLVLKENRIRNITGAGSLEEIENHIKQCLSFCEIIKGEKGIDIGSGNGLPGVVAAIVYPQKKIHLLDSAFKKINFLSMVKRKCHIENLFLVKGRAEILGRLNEYRETFDFAMARALAPMKISAELCLPFVKKGGRFYVMSGAKCQEEIEDAEDIIIKTGGRVENLTRQGYAIIKKNSETPDDYPRKWKKICS
ncbi:MAG: 16S rRNA (guanine(527)-N(7))-methyltransferase RsmG [Elusimicrobiota bacterium]